MVVLQSQRIRWRVRSWVNSSAVNVGKDERRDLQIWRNELNEGHLPLYLIFAITHWNHITTKSRDPLHACMNIPTSEKCTVQPYYGRTHRNYTVKYGYGTALNRKSTLSIQSSTIRLRSPVYGHRIRLGTVTVTIPTILVPFWCSLSSSFWQNEI